MAYLTFMYVFFIENKQSFVCYVQLQRVVSYDLFLSYSGIFEINCSKDIKVQGIIGPCASLEKVSYKTVKGIYFSFAYCDQYLMIICRKDRCALTLPSVRDTQAHGRCVASTTTLPYVWFLKLLK